MTLSDTEALLSLLGTWADYFASYPPHPWLAADRGKRLWAATILELGQYVETTRLWLVYSEPRVTGADDKMVEKWALGQRQYLYVGKIVVDWELYWLGINHSRPRDITAPRGLRHARGFVRHQSGCLTAKWRSMLYKLGKDDA